jgi:metallo-beta-lactamase family protein
MHIEFFGATREVTGSCYLLSVGGYRILVECGMLQGSREHERHNHDAFPFDAGSIDVVVLTHAHIDHSGRLPLLIKRGYRGEIYTHSATSDLCRIMLEDSGYLSEKEVQWENRKRERKGLELLEPLYTRADARQAEKHFRSIEYDKLEEIRPGVRVTLRDAGHILGSAIAEFELTEGKRSRKVVFSGDLGHRGAPILRDPQPVNQADLVILESTYGDRLHRPWEDTWQEMGEVFEHARSGKGNILIPSFAVGRTQELLYVFKRNFDKWGIGDWQVFLDSPMAIEATEVYSEHAKVYDKRAREMYERGDDPFDLPNLYASQSTEESMKINQISSGAIIIAGSGMCTGGRIKHHMKHNIWRKHAHLMMAQTTFVYGVRRYRSMLRYTPSGDCRRMPIARDCSTGMAISGTGHRWCWCTVSRMQWILWETRSLANTMLGSPRHNSGRSWSCKAGQFLPWPPGGARSARIFGGMRAVWMRLRPISPMLLTSVTAQDCNDDSTGSIRGFVEPGPTGSGATGIVTSFVVRSAWRLGACPQNYPETGHGRRCLGACLFAPQRG